MPRGELIFSIQTLGHRGPSLPEERCKKTRKRRFESQSQGEAFATEWAHHNSSEYDHAYFCKHCKGWHLTKMRERSSLSVPNVL